MEHVFGIKVKLNLSPHKDIKSFHFQHLCFVFEDYPPIHCFPLILVRVYGNLHSLYCGRKPEYPQRTHTNTGRGIELRTFLLPHLKNTFFKSLEQ